MEEMSKFERCRHGFPDLKSCSGKVVVENKCTKKNIVVNEKDCEKCDMFNSRYIEYPIEVAKIDINNDTYNMYANRVGEFVKVRPCAKQYNNRTYLGILLGDIPTQPHVSYDRKSKELSVSLIGNPAIFVPELKKIVYGYESWWGAITSADDMKELHISDEDIENVWYVKAMKEMLSPEEGI